MFDLHDQTHMSKDNPRCVRKDNPRCELKSFTRFLTSAKYETTLLVMQQRNTDAAFYSLEPFFPLQSRFAALHAWGVSERWAPSVVL